MAAVQNQRRSSFRGVLIGSAVLAALTAGSAGGYWAGSLSAHSARTIVNEAAGQTSAAYERCEPASISPAEYAACP